MLCAVSDQTLSLPLETSRRLVEVELPELLQQLLASCSSSSPWPQADSVDLLPALAHPCWEGTQQLIADVFEVLSLLCGVAVRACTRSADPLMVLLQLSSPKVMAACTTPSGPCLPLASSRGVALMLAVLNGALAESIKDGSSERQALRGRLVRVAVHCLQLLCGCVGPEVLGEQLHGLTSALSSVVSAGGAYWDAHKRVIKSADLPYTGQVRCVDKGTGDMLVRYTMAAQGALVVLRQLLAACRVEPGHVANPESMMLSAGVLPAVEQLFRQIPVASPAHVAAADLLAQLLPLCGGADLACGQLPLMASMRKFLVKASGIAEPDRTAAITTATKLAEMVARLACCCASAAPGSQAGVLVQHTAAQLLPAFQVFCASVLKAGVPPPSSTHFDTGGGMTVLAVLGAAGGAPGASCHLYPALLSATQQLVELAVKQPELKLLQLLLGSHALTTAAAIVSTSYWATPQVAAVASLPGNASLTAEAAGETVASILECLLGAAVPQQGCAAAAAAPSAGASPKLLHASISDDCLCAIKLGVDGAAACCSPKACSDVTPATSGARLDAAEHAAPQPDAVQPLALLSALLESKLLPQAHRLLQQLPQQGCGMPEAPAGSTASAAGSSMTRQGSATGAVQVPTPRAGSQQYSKDAGARVGGHSPTYSILTGNQLRSQSSSSQQLLSGYSGSEPAYISINSSTSGSHALRVTAAHSRFAAGMRRSSDGTVASAAGAALAGTSPRAVDGDVGGLLRGGSWSSLQGAWLSQSSAGQADKERLGRQSSSGFGSTTSLGSLMVADSLTAGAGHGAGYSGMGSVTSPHGMDSGIDVLAGLRVSLAAVPAAAAAVQSPTGSSSPGRAVCGAVEGGSSSMLFLVDLGLAQLRVSSRQEGVAAGADGAAGSSVAARLVGDDVLRGVVAGVQAAAPLLCRACPPALDSEQCWQEALARLAPAPVGCWNAACVNMAGASEAAAPAKPCANCNVAAFCSKGCERAAWSGHTMACGKLAAAATAARLGSA
ncbi:hypothetical protein OEZ85_002740 [Tetradesmus obliquus]|uniref:MYND-type domain-containing protein n=1 Tax=Tetradesmus obliquus TaxID=3088 RepID=A0ABY8TYH4_TETOB|nr:hypothetical protein OEZ85_002740 [Tetradesmus obliquus]